MVGASRIGRGLLALTLLPGCARLVGGEAAVVLQAADRGAAQSELGWTTPPPRRARLAEADIWTPADRAPSASLVLAPGFAEAGRDDPRLMRLADALARAGFAVRVPDLPGARRLTLDPADIDAMRAALRAERASGRPVALAGVSFAAAPALIAARQEGGAAAVVTLGGLHRMEEAAVFAATGAHRAPGEAAWRRGAPNPFAAAAFLLAMADAMPDRADRWLLRETGLRRAEDPAAPLGDLARDMTPAGRAALALVEERDPEAVPARLAALPSPVREALAVLDPSRAGLGVLDACVLAVHGEADPIIPWTQSVALAQAVPRARLFLVPGFGHVEGGAVPPEGQRVLVGAMRALLGLRDGRDPCRD